MTKNTIILACLILTLTISCSCGGAATVETTPPTTEPATTQPTTTEPTTTQPATTEPVYEELVLSPDPAFVRVGNVLNITITEKFDLSELEFGEPVEFSYFSPAEFSWEEDSNGEIITFEEPGVVKGVSPGKAIVSITKNGAQGNPVYPTIEVQVLPAVDIPQSLDKEVVACYFPWFSERYIQPPPRPSNCEDWSIYTPTIKPYDPQSIEITEQHIRMAKDGGIDAFAISWFSPRTWDAYDLFIKPAYDNLLGLADQLDFKIYINYECAMNLCEWEEGGWLPLESEAARANAMVGAETDFISLLEQLSPIEDYPSFFLYLGAGIGLAPEDWAPVVENVKQQYPQARFYCDVPDPFWLTVFDGMFISGGCFYEDQVNDYSRMAEEAKTFGSDKRFYATVGPGFDSTNFWGPSDLLIPRNDGEYYRSVWEKAVAANPDGIYINSWNEWGESTVIEPSKEYGYQYIDITAEYAIILNSENSRNSTKKPLTSNPDYAIIILALNRSAFCTLTTG
ncbi:MAG: glycoside hydrolase family 99-like domain-containing protein [Dehalococcoidales bacterium]|nr:glycoside hydrolase family 99-like domain-containing protein [Dehalococcoidales bacterium]